MLLICDLDGKCCDGFGVVVAVDDKSDFKYSISSCMLNFSCFSLHMMRFFWSSSLSRNKSSYLSLSTSSGEGGTVGADVVASAVEEVVSKVEFFTLNVKLFLLCCCCCVDIVLGLIMFIVESCWWSFK